MAISRPKPAWLRRRLPPPGRSATVMAAIKNRGLHTVCEEAHCPNQLECFGTGTATFLLLGPSCTRRCTFCAVDKSPVHKPKPGEPTHIGEAVAQMELKFCVVTMVTRDDLSDGGARHVARTIEIIHHKCPGVGVEILISDLGGNWRALDTVLAARPKVLNHNLETVPRLYPQVRPQADYQRSLDLLSRAHAHVPSLVTKSGLMLGLGETKEEVLTVMDDLREAGCHVITLGQYLAPSEQHHPVVRYIPPEEFAEYEAQALARGFFGTASAPLARSSYRAEELYRTASSQLSSL
ncbi:MAG: lipoyl synthase [Deltaproteobacteria bacterium]|nr:MAG: lipoyl synthase [Deltaproteobacteria bacterium]